jgi:hypothetical protein
MVSGLVLNTKSVSEGTTTMTASQSIQAAIATAERALALNLTLLEQQQLGHTYLDGLAVQERVDYWRNLIARLRVIEADIATLH